MTSKLDCRITNSFFEANGFPLEPSLLVLGTIGSHSHGTYMPPEEDNAVDDIDFMGIVVPPVEYHLGLPQWSHWTMQKDELDVVLYSLDKAIRMLLKSNPNIIGLLWLRDQDYLFRHSVFNQMMTERKIFSAQTAARSFMGYAYDRLKRMETFDLERMEEYGRLADLIYDGGLEPQEVLQADAIRLRYMADVANIPVDSITQFRKLHKKFFSGYMGAKRKALIKKYGYDVKNASHLIRLLRMGVEFLETGNLQVYRKYDAEELKAIKRGKWSLEEVKQEAEWLFMQMKAAEANSPLQEKPNREKANRLLLDIHYKMLKLNPE